MKAAPLRSTPRLRHGFTLLEVLMAVAVIAILMAIIIPALGGAQNSAKRAKTRAQFAQWSTAIEMFRQEYGYYPAFQSSGTGQFTNGLINDAPKTQRFVETLSGRRRDGTAFAAATDPGLLAGNTKRITFCSFGSNDLTTGTEPLLQDAFGNTQIVVLLDRNLSGIISSSETSPDYTAPLPPVVHADSNTEVTVPAPPAPGIRAGVAFYSAGDGNTPVTSW